MRRLLSAGCAIAIISGCNCGGGITHTPDGGQDAGPAPMLVGAVLVLGTGDRR